MDTLNQLMHGFAVAITPINLMWALVGCFLGTAIGVLPGIGPALTVAMLLPLTAKVEPTAALIMFAGIYYGAMYGGSTTSILMNTPGESSTMVTAMEGNLMAKNGRAARHWPPRRSARSSRAPSPPCCCRCSRRWRRTWHCSSARASTS